MAKYEIDDILVINTDSGSIINETKQLDNYVTSLDNLVGEIKEYWVQEAPDATRYVEALTKTISNLRGMITCYDKLGNAMSLYSVALKNTSSKNVNG